MIGVEADFIAESVNAGGPFSTMTGLRTGEADANVAACFLAYASGYYAHPDMEIPHKPNHPNERDTPNPNPKRKRGWLSD